MLENIDETKVFDYFEKICSIPRGSGNNTAISEYLVAFAKEHQLKYRKDAYENVIIWKNASKGYENKPGVILQGHMDMVCEKEKDCRHDFMTEPLDLFLEGDYVQARGTTLGGDDGIAIAYALAILEDPTLQHPPLEVVITTDEETGMDGAIGLQMDDLHGTYFINLDSEEEGTILASCAGGMSVNGTFPVSRIRRKGYLLSLQLDGLQGGHSGTEIDKNRENAVKVLGRILSEFQRKYGTFALAMLQGGCKDNAIPREAQAKILIQECERAEEILKQICRTVSEELKSREPNANISYAFSEIQEEYVMDEEITKKLLFFLLHVPNGVQRMSAEIPGLVESSLNLGICKTGKNLVYFSFSVRSALQSYKAHIGEMIRELMEETGGVYEEKSAYPAWEYRKESKLRKIMVDVYEKQYGAKPKIEAIHAGLECGILSGKKPELDMVSIGPDILDIHTPKERLVISSTQRVYEYVKRVLEEICRNETV